MERFGKILEITQILGFWEQPRFAIVYQNDTTSDHAWPMVKQEAAIGFSGTTGMLVLSS